MRRPYWVALAALALACSDDEAVTPSGPAFEGVSWVAADSSGRLVVGWRPVEGAAEYRIYASLLQGRPLRNAPIATATSSPIVVAPTTSGQRHHFVVRAVDAAGNEDGNVVEKSGVAVPDTTPPQFAGIKAITSFSDTGAEIAWEAAGDDSSPPEAIAYDVYAGRAADALVRVARTAPGATGVSVTGLGQPAEPFLFAVRARDVAGNLSSQGKIVSVPLGADAKPPAFRGCDRVESVGSRTARVVWSPATDDHSPPEDLQYEVYAAKASGAYDFAAPPAAKIKGATSVELANLEPGTSYFLVCRARDGGGNVDANTTEKTIATSTDVSPPLFDGLTDAVLDPVARTVALSWSPATDDRTAQAAIVYDVYESSMSGSYDFTSLPRASSAPGATSLVLTDLRSRVTLNWVVRARDEAFNRDGNLKEKGGDTKTSFSLDVLPIFVHACAVVGCHVSGAQAAGLNLAPGFAYAACVGKVAVEQPAKRLVSQDPVDPLGDSYLYEKITEQKPFRGAQMPAPQTGNSLSQLEKDVITSWILDGAPNN